MLNPLLSKSGGSLRRTKARGGPGSRNHRAGDIQIGKASSVFFKKKGNVLRRPEVRGKGGKRVTGGNVGVLWGCKPSRVKFM